MNDAQKRNQRHQSKDMVTRPNLPPDLALEIALSQKLGLTRIAGIDEAGRGALAGPVVAAAVILPLHDAGVLFALDRVTDSKLLSAKEREGLFPLICSRAMAYSIGFVSAEIIDASGIMAATRQAMVEAVAQLMPAAEALLIDGRMRLPALSLPQQDIIRGDQRSLSVAAASILAKVSRDRYMLDLDARYPGYGFARHKGYGTVEHRQALDRLGACPEHRLSFAPLRATLL
jgi:ribonuclease HII